MECAIPFEDCCILVSHGVSFFNIRGPYDDHVHGVEADEF